MPWSWQDEKHHSLFLYRAQNLHLSYPNYKNDTVDTADLSSMQDAFHLDFVMNLAHRRVSVALWSIGALRFDSSWRLTRSWHDEKHFSLQKKDVFKLACGTGVIFSCFTGERRQASGDRDSRAWLAPSAASCLPPFDCRTQRKSASLQANFEMTQKVVITKIQLKFEMVVFHSLPISPLVPRTNSRFHRNLKTNKKIFFSFLWRISVVQQTHG